MSKIVDCLTALEARIITVLPNHFELSNPYAPEQNSEHMLKQSWGLRGRSGNNSLRNLSCRVSIRRTIEIVLTRKYYAAEMNRAAKKQTEYDLWEDQFLIIKDIEKDPTLNNSSAVTQFGYVSDGGIEYVFSNDKPYLMIVSQFDLEYIEDLNA